MDMTGERVTKDEAEQAIQVLLKYIGEDINREGLLETPARVIKSYKELFAGYNIIIDEILDKRFYDISTFNDVVMLKSIDFSSTCEHHMLSFVGSIDIAYIPNGFVLGISKVAKLVDAHAKRLQIQERMTADIAEDLQKHLNPMGVAIRVKASHSCMTSRGVSKGGSLMETVHFTGDFKNKPEYRKEFWSMING